MSMSLSISMQSMSMSVSDTAEARVQTSKVLAKKEASTGTGARTADVPPVSNLLLRNE